MKNEKWVETKREFTVNENGEYNLSKVTKELNTLGRKERLDIRIRIIPIIVTCIAVLIPVCIFYLQQEKENVRQRKLFELETYTNLSANIQLAVNKNSGEKEQIIARDEVLFRIYPKIR